ncbi:UDP-N-acetylmuramate--L-alanine ligase [Pediococcus acidilactici]|nr:UDP-N-acetylmuramate--L-alanine ligase [Pediococcus acidilactici]KAF0337437.1 UDP-N-acetylmuramate--L-alanine ligase [Pediococcus acidilactici]KAF0339016.1 UDP-N-acetylmuramate--L-alanine ligase [Pediococcus acidilactici]KAF0345587.1 UDP-N-acetylmuramate--L-alanine ligase [Pediococcus acidilactici]KAF0349468.1 UDP-N-acetylmuramate--L-alanine ligase [Pediococcus acidilactici]
MGVVKVDKDTIYYFIGIKGSGMSSLALILHDEGYQVEGSDVDGYVFTQDGLAAAGIKVLPFNPDNLRDGLTVIAGNAFTDDHPEIKRAREMGLKVVRYHEFLGQLLAAYTSIGVAGTHGKTSTTGLLAYVLGGVDKTSYLIGDGTGKGVPDARFFVFEADEYRRHFIAYHPDYMIMTNVDFDHPDYYKDLADVESAFQQAASQVKKGLFAWGEDASLRKLHADVPVYYYGTADNDDFQAKNIVRTTTGSEFDVEHRGEPIGHFKINLFGEHNVLNTLAVIAVAYFEKIDLALVQKELLSYQGVKRRFSKSTVGDNILIDDYAHHPSEIKATLDAARQEFPDKKIVAVFQPHTYTRTAALLDGFAKSLSLADQVVLTEIFGSVREANGKVSSQDLANLIGHDTKIIHEDDLSALANQHNAVLVFMGAGDILKYEDAYKALVKEK